MATVRRGIRRGFRLVFGVLTAPPHIRAIFHEAHVNLKARAAQLDIEQPGWREFSGPSALPTFSAFVNEVASNKGHVDEVRVWVKKLLADDEALDVAPGEPPKDAGDV